MTNLDHRQLEITLDIDELTIDDELRIPVQKLIDLLQEKLALVPEEHRASAEVKFWNTGEYAHLYTELVYRRPETDAELHERQLVEATLRQTSEIVERREYERLKRKFEPEA